MLNASFGLDSFGRFLVTVSLAILFMGIASPLFTRRMEASVSNVVTRVRTSLNLPQSATIKSIGLKTANAAGDASPVKTIPARERQ
jgi:hypothetical protein